MAKLYAELTSDKGRKVSKSDDTRLLIDLYQNNNKIGTVGLYQIFDTGGYRVTYDKHGEGFDPKKPDIDNYKS